MALLLGGYENSLDLDMVKVAQPVNILKPTELYIPKEWILWYMDYI